MIQVDNITQQAEQYCKARGARLTPKRKQILAGLLHSRKALSAYELMDFYQQAYGESIPAMSVYRILEFLTDEHLVHKLNMVNKYVACAHIGHNRAHEVSQFLICRKCSKVKEISIEPDTMTELQATVQGTGFELISPQIELNCLCEDCIEQVV